MRILVVGAGGYVGGRLASRLLAMGHHLVLASRQPALVAHRFPSAVVVVAEPGGRDLRAVCSNVGVRPEIVYEIPEVIVGHGSSHRQEELALASEVGAAAAAIGASRIISLGELGDAPKGSPSSLPGAMSERATELGRAGVPVLELRSSLEIGSGSAPFEMVRHLSSRVPVMTMPRWVELPAQPIAIRDVLDYLAGAIDVDATGAIEIGGPEALTFAEMLARFERALGLRRFKILLPITSARASDTWISLVSPLPRGVARAIIERLQHGSVVRDPAPARAFGLTPLTYDEALDRALERLRSNRVETTWFDSFDIRRRGAAAPLDRTALGRRMLMDRRVREVAAPPERVFAEIEGLGGAAGWPWGNLLWKLRGWIDRLVGGVGMRLGRRDPEHLRVGDAVDFWRVEAIERPALLRLRAEMRVPGKAWLEFTVEPTDAGSRLVQTAYFDPRGLGGRAYWYLLLPVHLPVFERMVDVLGHRAILAPKSGAGRQPAGL